VIIDLSLLVANWLSCCLCGSSESIHKLTKIGDTNQKMSSTRLYDEHCVWSREIPGNSTFFSHFRNKNWKNCFSFTFTFSFNLWIYNSILNLEYMCIYTTSYPIYRVPKRWYLSLNLISFRSKVISINILKIPVLVLPVLVLNRPLW
jgi:hypothetical protein